MNQYQYSNQIKARQKIYFDKFAAKAFGKKLPELYMKSTLKA